MGQSSTTRPAGASPRGEEGKRRKSTCSVIRGHPHARGGSCFGPWVRGSRSGASTRGEEASAARSGGSSHRAHPRARGGRTLVRIARCELEGTSQRAGKKGASAHLSPEFVENIPARDEEGGSRSSGSSRTTGHPRARGGRRQATPAAKSRRGSSARGDVDEPVPATSTPGASPQPRETEGSVERPEWGHPRNRGKGNLGQTASLGVERIPEKGEATAGRGLCTSRGHPHAGEGGPCLGRDRRRHGGIPGGDEGDGTVVWAPNEDHPRERGEWGPLREAHGWAEAQHPRASSRAAVFVVHPCVEGRGNDSAVAAQHHPRAHEHGPDRGQERSCWQGIHVIAKRHPGIALSARLEAHPRVGERVGTVLHLGWGRTTEHPQEGDS